MLGVHRVQCDRADYYLSDLAYELPVASPAHWAGRAASSLGLQGPLDPHDFRLLLDGRHPATGRQMSAAARVVAGFDLTFAVPKSASVLFALGGPEVSGLVLDAHAGAVEGALAYVEDHAFTASRRVGTDRLVLPTSGAVAGVFTHGVNRNLDPHVHSHVVVANLVHAADGRWSACDWRGLDAHRRAASAVYDAHFRHTLTHAVGVRWVDVAGRAEVAGVTPALLGEFSSRSADIRRHLHELGATSARANHIAWAMTRPDKTTGLTYDVLSAEWAHRAQAAGRTELGPVLGAAADEHPRLDEHRYGSVLSVTPHGGAHRRDVVEAVAIAARSGTTANGLDQLVRSSVPGSRAGEAGVVGVGVAEQLHRRSDVTPANHLLEALGPRPVDPTDHAIWLGAAATIDTYRERWGVNRAAAPLGVGDQPAALAALPAARLADHLRTARAVDEARARLGVRAPLRVELGLTR